MSALPTGNAHPGELLTAHMDGELDPVEAVAVDAHLTACRACATEFAELGRARTLVRSLPLVPAPPGLTDKLIARRRRASQRGAAVAAVAAAAAVVVGLTAAEPAPPAPGPAVPGLTADGPRADLPPAVATPPSTRDVEADARGGDSLSDRISAAARDLVEVLTG